MWKRTLIALLILAVCLTTGLYAYHRYLRTVRIALVGFSDTDWAEWEAAAHCTSYTLHRYEREDLASAPLANYHVVFLWAMGLHLDEQQLAALDQARTHGVEIIPVGATNQTARDQATLAEPQQKRVEEYRKHGGRDNLVGLLHYLAHETVGKEVDVPAVVEKPQSGFFHLGDTMFETLDAYEAFLHQQRPQLPPDAPKLALFGPFLRPQDSLNRTHVDYMIQAFEGQGIRVYPIFGSMNATALLEQVKPDLVIAFPHGRLAPDNQARDVLGRLGAPCLTTLAINTSREEWLADERGIAGGFLSQSVTMPELDGAIKPIAVTALEPNERNIRVRTILEDRVEKRVALASNWLKLRRKANAQKRVVIVYYKAPGLAALAASGLEVAPSLFHTLKRLEQEGYDLGGKLPETPEALFVLIQKKGKTLGQWAIGSYEKFLEEAEPEFIPAEQYAQWFRRALSPKRQNEVVDLWGPIPGKQMVAERDGKPYLVVSRIRFGNVVIMPQPTVGGGGEGEDEVKTIHGTDKPVPHWRLQFESLALGASLPTSSTALPCLSRLLNRVSFGTQSATATDMERPNNSNNCLALLGNVEWRLAWLWRFHWKGRKWPQTRRRTMVAVQLDQDREELLDQLARAEGAEPADIVRRVLEDYLDFHSLPKDDVADWAEASAALAPEIMGDENWDEQ